jgi:acyl-CoA thioester hydrolase
MATDLDTPYRGGFVGSEHRFALSVYFEDTDAYGIVYYANYLKFMERARSDMIRAVGVDQAAELHRSGSAYAVVEVDIKYRRPGRLGDDLQVVSEVQQVTDARVTAAFLDGQGKPRRQPSDWVEKFKAITKER